jgi:dehydrogenase/reductase SDR family protein 4
MNNQRLFDLSGKVALIIGTSRGIGDAIALACAQDGTKMEIVSRKQADLDGVAEHIREAGSEALPLTAHTCDPPTRARVAEKAIITYDGIEIVVNGVVTNRHFGPSLTAEDTYLDTILDVVVKGYFRIVKAYVKSMKALGREKIINMASVAGLEPQSIRGIYSVSKVAVLVLNKVLAAKLTRFYIQGKAIAFGLAGTKSSPVLGKNPQINQAILNIILQRLIDEIAGLAIYLASPASSFVTGSTFGIDGGQSVDSPIEL